MKTVKFKGEIYKVPYDINYIAQNADGSVFAHEGKPCIVNDKWESFGLKIKLRDGWKDSLELV